MFLLRSRYRDTALFAPNDEGVVVFRGVRPRAIGPATGVIEHTVIEGNRLDALAQHFHGDDRLWYRLADANPTFLHAAEMLAPPMHGDVVLVPKARE